jgi:ADP-ribose pyrophosphatase YjhB (NUDIX family)
VLTWRAVAVWALMREMREETGLEAEPGRLLYVCDHLPGDGTHVVHLTFEARRTGGVAGSACLLSEISARCRSIRPGILTAMEEREAREWLAALPAQLQAQRRIMERLLNLCLAQPAARVFLVGCSIGRGAADELSDVDCFVGCQPEGVGEVVSAVRAALPEMGELVDALEHPYQQLTRIVGQFSGCVQLDLVVGPAHQGRAADEVVLFDPDGLMTTDRVVSADIVTAETVREWAFLGWEALADLVKYLRRGSLWEALARLNEARDRTWALWAAARKARYPAFGLSQVLDRDPGDLPDGIEATVAGLDAVGLRAAAIASGMVLKQVSALAAQVHGGTLPDALARHVMALLHSGNKPAGTAHPSPSPAITLPPGPQTGAS